MIKDGRSHGYRYYARVYHDPAISGGIEAAYSRGFHERLFQSDCRFPDRRHIQCLKWIRCFQTIVGKQFVNGNFSGIQRELCGELFGTYGNIHARSRMQTVPDRKLRFFLRNGHRYRPAKVPCDHWMGEIPPLRLAGEEQVYRGPAICGKAPPVSGFHIRIPAQRSEMRPESGLEYPYGQGYQDIAEEYPGWKHE